MEYSEPPPASKVWYLHFEEGRSYRDIAEMYGISVESAYLLAHASECSGVPAQAPLHA